MPSVSATKEQYLGLIFLLDLIFCCVVHFRITRLPDTVLVQYVQEASLRFQWTQARLFWFEKDFSNAEKVRTSNSYQRKSHK